MGIFCRYIIRIFITSIPVCGSCEALVIRRRCTRLTEYEPLTNMICTKIYIVQALYFHLCSIKNRPSNQVCYATVILFKLYFFV